MGLNKLASIVFICFGSFAVAQLSTPPLQSSLKSEAKAHDAATVQRTLTLNVVVSAKNGKPVSGLQRGDFTVLIDKKPLPVLSFQAQQAQAPTTVPVDTILLVDAVNTRYSRVAYERNQIERYLRRNGGKLTQPTALAVLTDSGIRITPASTQDGNGLAAFLEKVETGTRFIRHDSGFYGWAEQFEISTRALRQLTAYETTRPGRKLLIWISPGWPLLSGPEVNLSDTQQQGLFRELVDISNSLRFAHITLTSIDPIGVGDAISYRTEFYKEFTKGVRKATKMEIGDLSLQVLALQSGGQVLNADNDVSALINTAASDAESFYSVTVSTPPVESSDEYHDIVVSLDKPGLKARTSTGFYDEP